jgi:hypothetical protein
MCVTDIQEVPIFRPVEMSSLYNSDPGRFARQPVNNYTAFLNLHLSLLPFGDMLAADCLKVRNRIRFPPVFPDYEQQLRVSL